MHLHNCLSWYYWLLSEFCLVTTGINRAINYVQQFIKSMNVIVAWYVLKFGFRFLLSIVSKESIDLYTNLDLCCLHL